MEIELLHDGKCGIGPLDALVGPERPALGSKDEG
jgi:hypothetical protein